MRYFIMMTRLPSARLMAGLKAGAATVEAYTRLIAAGTQSSRIEQWKPAVRLIVTGTQISRIFAVEVFCTIDSEHKAEFIRCTVN